MFRRKRDECTETEPITNETKTMLKEIAHDLEDAKRRLEHVIETLRDDRRNLR